ncbi:diacylglycerol/polyprenol kinase family protein [Methanothermobacter wolfeii]|uniref:diacylglycerol/polyprenol kinase family protein n=1 Tax=Methanothermobacter wolfeii TaxID=145261 RepID=UPI0024B35A00|nr:diacylglycerol/polyprenol kinase family protein [Methanothermobacter wolfeii]MDI6702640.1 SEC59/DGK1/VTE5 family protein [Methanothermobacter wolfeii]MDI6841857.1 SEC59/DGK1/VTE5 family protein [Methanothermobacter wolfeii]
MKYRREFFRQLIHASGIIFIIISTHLNSLQMLLLSVLAAAAGEVIFRIDRIHYIPLLSGILRGCRRNTSERGFIYYFLGMAVTYAIFGFSMDIANGAIVILTLGDSFSTIIGREYGKHRLPFNRDKSIEGSLAFAFSGFIGALFITGPLPALTGAVTGALVEAYTPVEDNLTIPVFTGAAILLSGHIMGAPSLL